MNDCPNCEYHRQRAQLWRDEAYKQAGHPLPEREQEPVAWRWGIPKLKNGDFEWRYSLNQTRPDAIPLYTTPSQRKPLSEEEIGAILEDVNAYGTRLYTFARAIEAAHGIKGEA